jgi:hypothetical protein
MTSLKPCIAPGEKLSIQEGRKLLQKRPADLLEKDIRQQVKQYLTMMGWMVAYNLQGLGCYPGTPDLTMCKNGRVVQVELKTRRGRQSANQVKYQADWEAAGGEYRVIRSLDDAMEMDGEK